MQGSDKVLVQNTSVLCHGTDYFSRLRSVSWTESWHLIIKKNLSVIIAFNILQSRTEQCTCCVYHSSNNIIGDFYKFSLSQIFIVIANNEYTVMSIIYPLSPGNFNDNKRSKLNSR